MAIPKYDDLFNPVLKALSELGESASVSEMDDEVARILKLSEKEVNEIHKGNRTKLGYRLAWARNYLKRYGLLENSSRGIWALTQRGHKTGTVDKRIVNKTVKALDKREKKTPQIETIVDTENEEAWKDELIKYLKSIPPKSFEILCQRVLRESGFTQVKVTGKSGDGGIDGTGIVKISGLLSFHVVFQSKRYNRSVSSKIVRDFRGAMIGRADKGLIITTGTFTRDAKLEANRDGAPPIDLVDGNDLAEMLKRFELGIRIDKEVVEKVSIVKEWFENL